MKKSSKWMVLVMAGVVVPAMLPVPVSAGSILYLGNAAPKPALVKASFTPSPVAEMPVKLALSPKAKINMARESLNLGSLRSSQTDWFPRMAYNIRPYRETRQ